MKQPTPELLVCDAFRLVPEIGTDNEATQKAITEARLIAERRERAQLALPIVENERTRE